VLIDIRAAVCAVDAAAACVGMLPPGRDPAGPISLLLRGPNEGAARRSLSSPLEELLLDMLLNGRLLLLPLWLG